MIQAIKKWAGKSERNFNFLFLLLVLGFAMILVIGLHALFARSSDNWSGVFVSLFMLIDASAAIGFLGGFLFGIPRTLQGMPELLQESASPGERLSKTSNRTRQQYMVNTNLEQVSDWLTKIIVGVGLIQFNELKDFIGNLSTRLAADMEGVQHAKTLITADILYFLVVGFFFGYVGTRLYLTGAFAQAEEGFEKTHATITRLVNLDLDLKDFTHQEREMLKRVIDGIEKDEVFVLPDEFKPHSDQHKALEALEERHLIRVQEDGSWEPGKTVELTPIAQKILNAIKSKVTG